MKKIFTISLALLGQLIFAQYTTPNTGKTYNIADLDALTADVSYDAATNTYTLNQDLTIAETDIFLSDSDYTLAISEGKLITVVGQIIVNAPNQVLFTSTNPGTSYFKGVRLEENAIAKFTKFKMLYGGGLRALNSSFVMDKSEISYQNAGASTGGAINFSRGNPIITNSTFKHNITPVVGSGANQSVALTFENNYLEDNNKENSNRPQINMGPSGENQTTIIKNNTIIGNRANTRVGGISVSSLLSVISFAQIENNTIKDNRYGITITGVTAGGNIIGNTIENNNTENVPNTGGSGISISQTATAPKTSVTIKGNTIKGNLWGITIIGNGTNIDMTNGYNVFENNGNTGLDYALYNNSANNIKAQGNCWDPILTDERVENVIFHKPDNSTLGLVDHSNYACLLSTNEVKLDKLKLYPNPSNGTFVVDTKEKSTYQIYDINGRLVKQGELKIGQNNIQTNLKKGVYIMKTNQSSSKIIVK